MKKRNVSYAIPDIGEREIEEVIDAIKSHWLSKGPRTVEFEKQFSQYVGAEFGVGLNSCTAGLHLAQLAVGVGPGDEVITTPYTFASTVNTIIHTGATPVLVDIDPQTMNINPDLIEEKITAKTKAIIPVHFAGLPCEMDKIMTIAKKYNIAVIEDAAHAVYTKYHDQMVGSIGDITSFSFYATKNLVTGEGGMITTNNPEYAEKIRVMSLHGMSKNAWNRYSDKGSWYYEVEHAGFKYNMTDIQAAFGLIQLQRLEEMQQKRKQIATTYNEAFKEVPGLQIPYDDEAHRHAWHLYVLRIDEAKFSINRSQFIEELNARGVGTSVHFIPIPMHPYYKKMGYKIEDYPEAERAFNGEISLPLYPKMSKEDVEYVVKVVQEVAFIFKK